MSTQSLSVRIESWPLAKPFVIARGAKTEARVVVAEIGCGPHTGRGECVPYTRYGETVEAVAEAILAVPADITRDALARLLPAGAARNAVDCALWDLEAKRMSQPAHVLAGLPRPAPVVTCYTLSLDAPEAMAAAARAATGLPLLKLKLGGTGDAERMRAVREARPDARLVADANEAWSEDMLAELLSAAREAGLELIEQPLRAGQDRALASTPHLVPVCADESVHTLADLPAIKDRYDAVNIKLDKAGGLTEALALAHEAKRLGLDIMAGCMVATSLAMAPALLIAGLARWVDLDGPLLLAADRPNGLRIESGVIEPACPGLWG